MPKKTNKTYRTLVTIYPEIPTRPFFTLQSKEPTGEWELVFATTDADFYEKLLNKSGYTVKPELQQTEVANAL